MVYKQNTFLDQNFMIRAISPSSRYVVEGFVLRHLDEFRTFYNRFKPILKRKKMSVLSVVCRSVVSCRSCSSQVVSLETPRSSHSRIQDFQLTTTPGRGRPGRNRIFYQNLFLDRNQTPHLTIFFCTRPTDQKKRY